jgi:hypothetical protein
MNAPLMSPCGHFAANAAPPRIGRYRVVYDSVHGRKRANEPAAGGGFGGRRGRLLAHDAEWRPQPTMCRNSKVPTHKPTPMESMT